MIGAFDWLIDEPPRIRNTGSEPGWLSADDTRTPPTRPFRASPMELTRGRRASFSPVHLRNCGRDRAARLRAVADHHHVVHHQRILFEHNVDHRAGTYGHLLFLVAYEAEFDSLYV